MSMQTVRDIMTPKIIWANKDDFIVFISEIMSDRNISCVIIKHDDEPVGIITERDLIKKVLAEGIDPKRTTCGQIMTTPLFKVGIDTKLEDALNLMTENHIRRLVITEGNTIVGLITQSDVLQVTKHLHESHKRMTYYQNIQSYVIIAIFSFVFLYLIWIYIKTHYLM